MRQGLLRTSSAAAAPKASSHHTFNTTTSPLVFHFDNTTITMYSAQQPQTMPMPSQKATNPSTSNPLRMVAQTGNEQFSPAMQPLDLAATQHSTPEQESPSRSQSGWSFRNLLPCVSKSSVMRTVDSEGQLFLATGSCSKPHPNKISKGGEDASIVHECNGFWLTGVLDGIGAWSEQGVDVSIYSNAFAQRITDAFVTWCHGDRVSEGKPLLKILESAFTEMKRSQIQGSCTICISMLFPSGQLHVLNLGDSGVRVVRNGKIVFASKEQQTNFNEPKQLGGQSEDTPACGDYTIVPVQRKDVYILGTDGVWDNIWQEDWMKMLQDAAGFTSKVNVEKLATKLGETAAKHGADLNYRSPFAVQARMKGIAGYTEGGKQDDVTVVVGQVR